ncbi:decarboxylase [Streptomyces ipomoeae]|uniref:Asp/Glu/Hydantoin racemase n=3 Tax=Streptomyces ipomoeae TaxID=103232 RepID=L1L717_9ACTN|nr:aspartate/glutamate racemase family protein [Streptomyces ipomoeae]EKX68418.1 Asp/Glu/Hydantoin racemase [Streptomyces ipomoeae 91-03]MDX2700261.1 aspartate/glutamate racemase family protein [Streptomyces ipomoeae]MDX2826208.1 aspartate/glutamate racemase family protein [Streptomyces ipomoeae]MDX2845504.1 aspartate/glutamate racemase family protein [Streptomyces ipomoeae]MDX2877861.1 aspartate/glutamate racemase family protein [Streptomyces ipomoeae]
MTALGFLYPGHSAEDDYPRIEQLLGSDIRVDVVHTDIGEDAHRVDALREMGAPERLAAGCEALRLSGAEAVVWACTSGSFVHGYEGAHDQIRTLAHTAGMPASSTSFAFVHAAREVGARKVAVAATYPEDVARLFADFLAAADLEVVALRSAGIVTAAEVATWGIHDILTIAHAADHKDADALLLPDTALHTASHIPTLEKELSKPVLTANQVSVWEALRLTDRRVNAPELGSLFTREPIVQV